MYNYRREYDGGCTTLLLDRHRAEYREERLARIREDYEKKPLKGWRKLQILYDAMRSAVFIMA